MNTPLDTDDDVATPNNDQAEANAAHYEKLPQWLKVEYHRQNREKWLKGVEAARARVFLSMAEADKIRNASVLKWSFINSAGLVIGFFALRLLDVIDTPSSTLIIMVMLNGISITIINYFGKTIEYRRAAIQEDLHKIQLIFHFSDKDLDAFEVSSHGGWNNYCDRLQERIDKNILMFLRNLETNGPSGL